MDKKIQDIGYSKRTSTMGLTPTHIYTKELTVGLNAVILQLIYKESNNEYKYKDEYSVMLSNKGRLDGRVILPTLTTMEELIVLEDMLTGGYV